MSGYWFPRVSKICRVTCSCEPIAGPMASSRLLHPQQVLPHPHARLRHSQIWSSLLPVVHSAARELTLSLRSGWPVATGESPTFIRAKGLQKLAKFLAAVANPEKMIEGEPYLQENVRHNYDDKILTAADVALGVVDVNGWSVIVEGKGDVGKVVEILQIGRSDRFNVENTEDLTYEYVMKVIQATKKREGRMYVKRNVKSRLEHVHINDEDEMFFGTEFLVPIVDEFVKEVDVNRRRLLITPPEGLLELARRPAVLRRLRPAILQFCMQHSGTLKERFTHKRKSMNRMNRSSDDVVDVQEIVCAYMPTRDQLQAAGRSDLVKEIKAAGGFLFVAEALNLKSTRRPDGFWEDLGKLDAEIERFVWESWTEKIHEETGMPYYENEVTKDVSLDKPKFSLSSTCCTINHEDARAMPQQKAVCKAHRWDLHHAIVLHGGYKQVARELGRKAIWVSAELRQRQINAISSLASKWCSIKDH